MCKNMPYFFLSSLCLFDGKYIWKPFLKNKENINSVFQLVVGQLL